MVFGKEDPHKLGLVTADDLKMTVYSKDTSAAALVLYDFGESSFTYTKGTQLQFKRTLRIKILKKAGLQEANLGIGTYFKEYTSKEKVGQVKGFTYNLENGKVVKTKLDEKAIFEEKKSANWNVTKIAMPNVKVGSVIEVSYNLTSDFLWSLQPWEFQKDIPVLWSEYRVNMVPEFEYTQMLNGTQRFHLKEATVRHETVPIVWQSKEGLGTIEKRSTMSQQILQHRWVMKDVPAFTEEPYLTSADEYRSQIKFVLTKIQYENATPRYQATTWEGLATELQKEENFGGQLATTPYLERIAAPLIATSPDPTSRTHALLAYVKSQMTWNGDLGFYSESIKKAHESRKGSSADINLLLTALLRTAGVPAKPVLVSTRAHGNPVTNLPMLNKFNYVVVQVTLQDKSYLIDATEPDVPFGSLPFHCLNGQGWVVDLPSGKWVPLLNTDRNVQLVTGQLEISPSGDVKGSIEQIYQGLSALQERTFIRKQGQENYLKTFSDEGQHWVRQEMKIQNLDNLQKPLEIKYQIASAGQGQPAQLLYLSPMLNQRLAENPFKITERQYPIDFASAFEETCVLTFNLPEGYEVEELPKNLSLSLPGNTIKYAYMMQEENGKLKLLSRLNINKAVFSPAEYANLRELYNQLVAKQAEKIVLRKKM